MRFPARRRWLLVALVSSLAVPAAAAPPGPPAAARRAPDDRPFEYLIVCPEAFAPEFERLADWKSRHGMPAAVRTLESALAAHPDGADDAERLRDFLREARERWDVRWVLLGGSGEIMPVRRAALDPIVVPALEVPTDWYFACLDGDWNADGDDRYGEPGPAELGGDQPDLEPELVVGRAPVADRAQAGRFVRRTLGAWRESRGGPGRDLVAAEAVEPILMAQQAETVLLPLLLAEPGNAVTRLYEDCPDDPFGIGCSPGWTTLSRAALLGAFAAGHRLWLLAGGGDADSIRLRQAPVPEYLRAGDLAELENGGDPGHLVLISSTVASFESAGALGPAFMHAPRGGAVSVVGPSCLQFLGTEMQLVRRYLELALAPARVSIGEALQAARRELAAQPFAVPLMAVYGFNLLGDPSLVLPGPDAGATASGGTRAAAVWSAEAAGPSRPAGVEAFRVANPAGGGGAEFSWQLDAAPGTRVDVTVFDLGGRRVREVARSAPAQASGARWDLRDAGGRRVAAGVYLATLTDGVRRHTCRVVVVP